MVQGWVRSALYALCLLALIHPASTTAQTAADYRKQATEFAQTKAWDDAIENYRDALALEPNDAITHYDLALALKYQGSTKEALKEFQAALQLQPKWADAHYGLGAVWYDLQDPDAALKRTSYCCGSLIRPAPPPTGSWPAFSRSRTTSGMPRKN